MRLTAAFTALVAGGALAETDYTALLEEHGQSFTLASTGFYGRPSAAQCAPPVLNQADCGSCYAFSTATTVGTSACIQGLGTGHGPKTSPQFTLGVEYASETATSSGKANPCGGGIPAQLIGRVAVYCADHANQCYQTCSDVCGSGCLPYDEGQCYCENSYGYESCTNTKTGGSCDTADFNLPSSGCADGSLTTADTGVMTSSSPLAVPLSMDLGSMDQSDATASRVTQATDRLVDVSFITGTQAQRINSTHENLLQGQATIGRVMAWLKTYGPVSIVIDACDGFQSFWAGKSSTGGGLMTLSWQELEDLLLGETTTSTTTTTTTVPGSTQPRRPPPTTANVTGCNGAPDHAVTVVGWQVIDGVPCWTIQNSWGLEHDSGFFHVPFSQVGCATSNEFTIAFPTGVYFTTASAAATPPPTPAATDDDYGDYGATENPLPGGEHPVSDLETLRTMRSLVEAAVQLSSGRNIAVSTVHGATRQVTAAVHYRVNVTVAPALTFENETENVVIKLRRHPNGTCEHVQTLAATPPANSKEGVEVGVPVVAIVVLLVAATAFLVMRRAADNAKESNGEDGAALVPPTVSTNDDMVGYVAYDDVVPEA